MQIEVWSNGKKITDLSNFKKECLGFSRDAGRVCYSKYDLEDIRKEEEKDKLIEILIKSGHHSPFDHPHMSLYLKNISKIFAMILNNEKVYSTSEKSARYTKMEMSGLEEELFNKWNSFFLEQIPKVHPNLDEIRIKKLAQENARYFLSVFTPTKLLHSVSFRQVNYLMHWFKRYIETEVDNDFTKRIKQEMSEFNSILSELFVDSFNPFVKFRNLSLFSKRDDFVEEFGENYSIKYKSSFACLAQVHRHRSINYEIFNLRGLYSLENISFYVPPLVKHLSKEEEWLKDMVKVKSNYPQATLVDVHEFGNYADFLSKAGERVCGFAQLETQNLVSSIMKKYVENLDEQSYVYSILSPCVGKAKCKFPNGRCLQPCEFGPIGSLVRKI